jgi:hypothetical protein
MLRNHQTTDAQLRIGDLESPGSMREPVIVPRFATNQKRSMPAILPISAAAIAI